MILTNVAFVVSLFTGATQASSTATAAGVRAADAQQQPQPARFDPSRFDSVTAISLRALLDTAQARGLPTSKLVNKALLGAARHETGARILGVVRAHLTGMLDARAAMGDSTTADELDAGADALRSGIDGRALVAIRGTRVAPGSAVTALVVMNDIVKRGVPPSTARDAIATLAKLPNADDALAGLQVQVAKNAARGGPGMALDALERYVRVTVPGGSKTANPAPATSPIRPTPP